MAQQELIMPKMGESVAEATIIKWLKNEGDKIKIDETVLEIATDKVDSEVPSTASGTLESVLYNVNDVVPIGAVIAKINTGENGAHASVSQSAESSVPDIQENELAQLIEEIPYQPVAARSSHQPVAASSGPRFYSPLVLKIVQEEGISMSELENIPGTGLDGRVSKKDILSYLENRHKKPSAQQPAPVPMVETKPAPANVYTHIRLQVPSVPAKKTVKAIYQVQVR